MRSHLLFIDCPAPDVCLFWFDGPSPYITSVAAICRGEHCLVIDSYCGSDYMDIVRQELEQRFQPKHFCLLNTHFHWDHIWGNCSFENCAIYSSSLCRQWMAQYWDAQLEENRCFFHGRELCCLPNICVDQPLEIIPDVFAFPSSGHTMDSISVWDRKNHFLFAGDLVESPVVQLNSRNLADYEQSLKQFHLLNPVAVFSGHCKNSKPEIITETESYLHALKEGKILSFEDETAQQTHLENQTLLRL